MFITAKLIFESYIPDELVPGMMFKQRIKDVVYGNVYEYDRIFMLNHKPSDIESYIISNGYPVRPTIVTVTANPDKPADILATVEQIGWWDDEPWDADEDDEDGEVRDVELKDFNYVLQEDDGYLDIEVNHVVNEDGEEFFTPVLFMDKVTLSIVTDDDYITDDNTDDLTDNDPQ